VIRGRGVALRPVEDDDAATIRGWQNDPEVWRSMDYERPFSTDDIREDIERSRREGHQFVIEVDGRPAGKIGLNRFRTRDRICSLYLFVGEPEFRGEGHALDAVSTLVTYAFDRFDLARIELWTLASNDRAIELYEACGFRREAVLPERSWKDGAWVDHVVMSVIPDAARAAAAAIDANKSGPD
jgi:RimJ/RimL family protein N-acetyltransferase